MRRRTFLGLTAASAGLLTSLPLPGMAAPTRKPRANITIITGVTSASSQEHLKAVLTSFLSLGFPVACVVDPSSRSAAKLEPDNPVALILRELAIATPGMLEIVAFSPDLSTLVPYFQSRAAYDARSELIEALGFAHQQPSPAVLVQSIACLARQKPLAPAGLRAAGFRSTLTIPEATSPVTSEIWDNGDLRLFGGAVSDIATATPELGQSVREQSLDLYYLSFDAFEKTTPRQAGQSAADYAQVALEQEIAGHISNQNLADLILRDNFGFQRFIGLHLFEPAASNPDLGEGFELFRAELLKLGFAHSHGPVPETSPLLSQMGYWVPSGLSQTDLQPEEVTQSMPVSLSGGVSDGDGFRVLVSDPAGGRQGLDANAHLRLPVLPLQSFFAGSNLAGLNGSSTSEFVLTISPDTLLTRPQRAMARRVLIDFSRAGVSEFVPVPVFARNRIPGGGVISRFRQVESARKTTRPVRKPIGAGDRQALLEDAKLAWQYFEQMTNPNTGLCPSTVAKSGSSSTRLEFITMWEMASHINGLIGAADIGILSRDGFRARMAKIMANIRGRSSNDRLLPQEWIHSDRNGSGNRNFDACDSSRLLAALLNLVDHPFSNVDVSALVESWDLDKVVVDKRIHSVIDQKLEPVFESHCGHYAARSFRLWGLEAQSPYEVTEGKSAADGQMELLHTAHNIGIIGTEPLLLEAMDFGMSTESSFLADTLFSAQLREYEKSGTLTCVSECSIEREPWFTYQGLDIGAQTDEWIVVATSDKAEFHNQKFAHDHLSLSAKGAYLWAAHHPHEYSDKLVSFVRENGKTDFGFVSSYYTNRGVATKGYSDLNTNGIILQAISRMLAGGYGRAGEVRAIPEAKDHGITKTRRVSQWI